MDFRFGSWMADQMMASFNKMENIREGKIIEFGGCQYKEFHFGIISLRYKLNENKASR